LLAQVAEKGDKIEDPSIAWPDSRKTVELGTLEVSKAVADSATAEKALLFIENNLPDGIAPADPMIDARSAAYPVSFARRHQQ
jgi:catalase